MSQRRPFLLFFAAIGALATCSFVDKAFSRMHCETHGIWHKDRYCWDDGSDDGAREYREQRDSGTSAPRGSNNAPAGTRPTFWWLLPGLSHTVQDGSGNWVCEDGYQWINPGDKRDLECQWAANMHHSAWGHVISGAQEGLWFAEGDWTWVNPNDNRDLRVQWVAGRRSKIYRHAITSDQPDRYDPEDGYDGDNASELTWQPNKRSRIFANVVAGANEGFWIPEDGYEWLFPGTSKMLVKWAPGRRSRFGHMRAAEQEGRWIPEWGYQYSDPYNPCWLCIERQPIGTFHPTIAHLVLSKFDANGVAFYAPADGYVWAASSRLAVRWMPGKRSEQYPHLIAGYSDDKWEAEQGWQLVDPNNPNDRRVEPVVPVIVPPIPPPDLVDDRWSLDWQERKERGRKELAWGLSFLTVGSRKYNELMDTITGLAQFVSKSGETRSLPLVKLYIPEDKIAEAIRRPNSKYMLEAQLLAMSEGSQKHVQFYQAIKTTTVLNEILFLGWVTLQIEADAVKQGDEVYLENTKITGGCDMYVPHEPENATTAPELIYESANELLRAIPGRQYKILFSGDQDIGDYVIKTGRDASGELPTCLQFGSQFEP